MCKKTQIQVSQEVWEYLKQEKKLGESYDQVLKRLLNIKETDIVE